MQMEKKKGGRVGLICGSKRWETTPNNIGHAILKQIVVKGEVALLLIKREYCDYAKVGVF